MLIREEETYSILGACFAAYRDKGCGFLEAVHQKCFAIEFECRNVPFAAQSQIALSYRGRWLAQTYVAEFLCYDSLIVEIKAVTALAAEHRAQVTNYVRATGLEVALLVNFGGHPRLEHERIVCTAGRYESE